MLKKALCLLLALLTVLPLFVACSKDGKRITLVKDGSSEYTIVCPVGSSTEQKAENAAALMLYEAIAEKTGVKLKYSDDSIGGGEDQPATAKEILVGATNRLESQSALSELRAKDFVISYANERVVILGGSAEATQQAVERFIDIYIDSDTKIAAVFSKRVDEVNHPYPVGDLSIDGVPLSTYRIVYPTKARKSTDTDLMSYYTALALSDYLLANAGITLKVVADSEQESEYELLVGATNRQASRSAAATTLSKDQYLLQKQDTKIVMLGNSYMVAGAASALVNTHFASQGVNIDINATDIPTTATGKTFTFQKATSAILMIGDGMGNNHIDATLAGNKLKSFIARDLPHQSLCTTASQSVLDLKVGYTDSAAAATALATGYKTLNGYLGMDENRKSRQNIRELAHEAGANTGVPTTDAITGATPCGFLCHYNDRNATTKLQAQIDDLVKNNKIDYCKGSVSTLSTPAREALEQISEEGRSFFMMIEEAHIDKRSHEANLSRMQDCVVRYNDCIAYVIAFVMLHPYTALIITADHETGGLTLQGDKYVYTEQPNPSKDYWQHTNNRAPVFGIGDGVAELLASATIQEGDTAPSIDNTDIAKFIATIYGSNNFGR